MEDASVYRHAVGLLVIVGGMALIAAMFFFPVPASNKSVLYMSIGLVLGWGGAVMNYEFGSSNGERKAAAAGIKTDGPQAVTVENDPSNPVPVEPK